MAYGFDIVRANENIVLTSIKTLFMREHNLIAAAIFAADPRMSDVLDQGQAARYIKEMLPFALDFSHSEHNESQGP